MAITDPTTGHDRLQAPVRRRLWMGFTRMGPCADQEAPVIARGEGCDVAGDRGNLVDHLSPPLIAGPSGSRRSSVRSRRRPRAASARGSRPC